ncbi:hypothetical protein IMSAG192_01217 [Muribaculaceae bacterium]|nr:hypothetical protein IMSAG192_01217 [Muribaculaceae bacterium]
MAPKLPSIWNGGCASNRLPYTPPAPWGVVSDRQLDSMRWAWLPSRRRAQKLSFHARLQPVPSSPRVLSVTFIASTSLSSRSERPGTICEPGCNHIRWLTCRWVSTYRPSESSQRPSPVRSLRTSSFHSINWPPLPMRGIDMRLLASAISFISGSSPLPSRSAALITASIISYTRPCDAVQPSEKAPCSGEYDGFTTRVLSRSSVQRASTQKSTAFFIVSKLSRRNSLSWVKL